MIVDEIENEEEFRRATEGRVVVDYFADWCHPCSQLEPVLKDIDAPVVKVDIDENPDLAQKHGVMGLPTLALFENGEELDRIIGAANKAKIENFYEA